MDAELRRKVRCVLGYCEPNQHECLYESSRNYSQELDEIDKLFEQEIAKVELELTGELYRTGRLEAADHLSKYIRNPKRT